jgi:hypothetical protein
MTPKQPMSKKQCKHLEMKLHLGKWVYGPKQMAFIDMLQRQEELTMPKPRKLQEGKTENLDP